LHLVEGSNVKGLLHIDKAIVFPVPDGCFSGETITNAGLLTEAVTEAFKLGGFGTREAVVTINASGAVIRDIDMPNAKPKELDEMIRNELVQTYHILPTDIVQYKPVDKVIGDDGTALTRYRATAIDQEIVDDYRSILVSAKLKPVAMDVNVNAVEKLLNREIVVNDKILNGNATMLIDFGDTLTTIYIVSQGKPVFHRHLNAGCGEIERYIYDETFTPEKEIRKLKEEGFNFFGEDETAIKYFNILRPFFYNFTDEIRKIIGFYTSRANSGNVEQILLFGGGSNMAGLAEYCESNFNVPAEQVRNITNVKFKDPATPIESYLNAIGALIRY